MKIILYRNDSPREIRIFKSFSDGLKKHGVQVEIRRKDEYGKGRKYEGPDPDAITGFYGVKSAELVRDHKIAACDWMLFDKGYIRGKGEYDVETYTRISINETYPIQYLNGIKRKNDRFDATGIRLSEPSFDNDGHVLVAGSSQKFYSYFGLGDEARLHSKIIKQIRRFCGNRIVFRPKPSYEKRHEKGDGLYLYGADEISFPDEHIGTALKGAKCLVTFASNAACDAVFNGIPIIVLGPHITDQVSEKSIEKISSIALPDRQIVSRWASSLAYEQFTLNDMVSGSAWDILKDRLEIIRPDSEPLSFEEQTMAKLDKSVLGSAEPI